MNELEKIIGDIVDIERGAPRLNAFRNAIQQADERNELIPRFVLRYGMLQESIFSGDRYYAMIIFPELLALFDENERIRNIPQYDHSMMVAFKWIVECAPEFPHISKAEIDSYFRLFKRRLLERGHSLSIYHMKRCLFYMHCDKGIAAADFYRFLDAPLDDISDGKALYHDQQAMYYLSIGEEEKALKAAEPIFSGELTSNALPQATHHFFIRFYLDRGEYAKAMEHAKHAERRSDGDPYYLDILGTLLALYGMTEPEHGLRLFVKNHEHYAKSRSPLLRMYFAIGAYHLFRALPDHAVLPDGCALPKDSGLQEMDIPALRAHFEAAAKELAQKFDARNGTDDFMNMLQNEYPAV